MTQINLIKRFVLSDLAKSSLKISYIKNSIVKVNESFDGKKMPIFVKVYRIPMKENYKVMSDEDRILWDKTIQTLIEKLPSQVQLSYKSCNVNSKVNFWKINKSILEKEMDTMSSIIKNKGVSKEYVENLFEQLEEFCLKNIYTPRLLDIKREYYLTIPYFRYETFKGITNNERLTELEKKMREFCDENGLKPFKEELYKLSQGKIHDFKQESLMRDFFEECDKIIHQFLPDAKLMSDQELSTLYYSRYFHNVYTELNDEQLYLTIHDMIQIAGEYNSEFTFLHNFYPFRKNVKPNYLEYNNRFFSIISIFRTSDYTIDNQLDFITEMEGDIDFQVSYTPIEKDNILKAYDTDITNLGHELEKRQLEDDVDENLITIYNREKLRRDYIQRDKTQLFKFRAYVLVREKNLKALNDKTNEVINKILSRGYWAKRISSDNLENDLRTVSYTGVDCGKSGWRITSDTIARGLNFMHLDFDLHSAQGLITDLDLIDEQLELLEDVKADRKKSIEGKTQ